MCEKKSSKWYMFGFNINKSMYGMKHVHLIILRIKYEQNVGSEYFLFQKEILENIMLSESKYI